MPYRCINTGSLSWSHENSDPIGDIRSTKRDVLEATGFEPNKIIFGETATDALVNHPNLIIIDDPYDFTAKITLREALADPVIRAKFNALFSPDRVDILYAATTINLTDPLQQILKTRCYQASDDYDLVHGGHNGMSFPTNRR